MQFSNSQLRRFLVQRSFLGQKANSIEEVVSAFGALQVDPINVVARAHELALWNRVSNFKIADLDRALYKKRTLFEHWLQLFSIIPLESYPFLRPVRENMSERQQRFLRDHGEEVAAARRFIEENGPTSAKELAHIPWQTDWTFWTKPVTRALILDHLWDRGEIMIHHRERNRKFFDLAERILPAELREKMVTEQESLEFLLDAQFRYFGLLRPAQLNRSGSRQAPQLKKLLQQKVEFGDVVKVEIDTVKTAYFLCRMDAESIGKLNNNVVQNSLYLFSPLDPLVLDRQVLRDVFDFEYTWEAYVPAAKRKFGYYGMPILCGDEFIGQIDLKKNAENRLDVLNRACTRDDSETASLLDGKLAELERFIQKNNVSRALSTDME